MRRKADNDRSCDSEFCLLNSVRIGVLYTAAEFANSM